MRKRHLLTGLGGLLVLGSLALLWQLDLPHWQKLDTSRLASVRQTTLVYGADGEAAGSLYGSENRVAVSLEQIPQHVQDAFIAAEDIRFYRHHGVDIRRVFGALWQDISALSFAQGASTITQQLIKLTHLSSEKTLSRKAQEAVLALQLERRMSKRDILENYLNIVYFGSGAYGIEAAANVFFDKSASELSLAEGALLAGLVKSPSGYAPGRYPEKAIARRNSILDTMASQAMISSVEAQAARQAPLELAARPGTESDSAVWYLDAALQETQDILHASAEEVLSGGYRIYTALDREMQSAAEELYGSADNFPASAADGTPVQSAMVILDPRTGEIRALMGGRSYDVKRGLNRATQIQRSPGSAIKPVSVYAAAIDSRGYVPSDFADDTQRVFEGGYTPHNAGNTYNGLVTLREALSRSLNVATVDLAETIGMPAVCAYAERFGIALDKNDSSLSLALGSMTYGVSPAKLCAAYAALANGGKTQEAHVVRRIESASGKTLYAYKPADRQAVRAETAYLITDMLKTAVSTGSARALNGLDFPVAAKTGTVGLSEEGNRDAWTVAYTPDLGVCVWMGFDEPDEEHMLSNSTGGGSYPARLAAAYLGKISSELSKEDFNRPAGLRSVLIDRLSLEQTRTTALVSANTPRDYTQREYFFADSLPESVSKLWSKPQKVCDLRLESEYGDVPVLSFTVVDANTDYILLRKTNGITEIATIMTGTPGQALRFADIEASLDEIHEYTIIPRHRLLYEKGILLAGDESDPVSWRPGGLLNRVADYWLDAPVPAPTEEAPVSAQSIFD